MAKNLVRTQLEISGDTYYVTFNHHTGYVSAITLWDDRGYTDVEFSALPRYVQTRIDNHILSLCFGGLN